MAGHSKWANIQHRKGAQDKKRGKLFTKLIREVTIAARTGGADLAANPRLRVAVDKAKTQSMPKENIERAIKRGAGDLDGVDYQDVTYEGYGPGGVAIIVEATTDNRRRTVPEMRKIFDKGGGNLGDQGSVAWMFKQAGLFIVDAATIDEDELMMTALEAGAGSAIGFDFDQAVLDLGFSRSQKTKAPFLPLFLDAANPSPDQGWAAKARKGLQDRATADGLLALAFVHHMAIAKNIPLKGLLSWLTGFAPQGVIEFVPKSDAMVQELLRLRKDIFEDYTEEAFFGYLQEFATVERSLQVSQSGRKLVWYRR